MIASILERIYCVGGKVVVLARDFDKDALIALVLRPFADTQEVIDVVALVVVELHGANAVNLLQHLHQLQGQLLQALSRAHGTRTGKVHLLYTHLRCATTHQRLWGRNTRVLAQVRHTHTPLYFSIYQCELQLKSLLTYTNHIKGLTLIVI